MTIHLVNLTNSTNWYEFNHEIPLNTLRVWRDHILSTANFKFEGWTGQAREPYRHWAYYPEVDKAYEEIFECLNVSCEETAGLNLKLDRIIVNMYNHGDSSWLHVDCSSDNAWTILLFCNEYWNINWGGDFVLSDGDNITQCTAPTPGKFVLFKSNQLHAARPVSREAQFPRLGVAFQCTNKLKT